MLLLDRVAQCRAPLVLAVDDAPARQFSVTAPSRYASLLADCPFRFVLGDDVAQACGELAFADGARLAGCLDLLRFPAPLMWIEWNDGVHMRVIEEAAQSGCPDPRAQGRRAGALVVASARGREATVRTFWSSDHVAPTGEVTLSPIETLINLDGGFGAGSEPLAMLRGEEVHVSDDRNDAMATLLDHVRFRFDRTWADYYRAAASSPDIQRSVVDASLAAVARDTPFLLAFLLLQSAREATRLVPVSRLAINRKRAARGRSVLLDHVEVHTSLDAVSAYEPSRSGLVGRQSPRLHHVRGHLVRRDNHVYWRSAHVRGSAFRGTIRSRTVHLAFDHRH